ncbi:LacI family DNA-binding transcriptional regulator [Gracilibacillus sp. HCP3S3_G5_1]|uniref:LacI family DNA-binding transcriptional regulator n=1 Tax=unclassified Gracilibacillus TaxID=2625209 RepID=UPI003F8C72D1
MKKRVTIKDVANDCNVSIATVSKVINKKGYVSKETLSKVIDSINRLGYSVNANARSLKSSKSNKVAVLISDISNLYLMTIAKEVEKTIRSLGLHMILLSHNDEKEAEFASLQIIMEQQVDALVIIPTGGNADMIQQILNNNIPVIALDRKVDGIETDLIVDDNYYGSYESIKKLYELGHTKIGVLYGHKKNSIGRDRYAGALDAFNDLGIQVDTSLWKETNFAEDIAYRLTMELLLSPNPPTALYSCNNTITKGMLKAIKEQGIQIPNQLSVIAFGDSQQWELLEPKLSLMTQPVNRIGLEATILLKNRLILNSEFPPKEIVIKPTYVEGDSTKDIR